jgi:hypothetical protein
VSGIHDLPPFGIVRHCSASFGIVRHRSASFGIVRHRSASFGIVRHRSASPVNQKFRARITSIREATTL